MAQWGEALEKMKQPAVPSAGSPGMGAGNVPFAPGMFQQRAPGPVRGNVPQPPMGPPPGPAGVAPPVAPPPNGGGGPGGPPMGPPGQPQMGGNPLQFQAEVLSTLMSAVMASIQRQKSRRMGGSGSGY